MKTLVNCKPSEFLRQTNKIKKSVEKWLTLTDVINLRKRAPKNIPPTLPKGATKEDVKARMDEVNKAFQEQSLKNMSDMLDAMLDKYPDETLEVIALCCFIEPEEIDNYKVADILQAISELIADEAVLGFFTSLARLGVTDTPNVFQE